MIEVPSYLFTSVLISVFFLSGCAFHHYDEEAGVEHVWGLGHMKMKVQEPSEGRQAIVSGIEAYGAALGTTPSGAFVSLGWFKNQEVHILDENAQFRLEWPQSDFFSVRVGSAVPQSFTVPSISNLDTQNNSNQAQ